MSMHALLRTVGKSIIRLGLVSFIVPSLICGEEPLKLIDQKVKLSDGVRLSTDIYLPESTGKHPVILIRTPYDKSSLQKIAESFSESGYAVVIQDVRGQGRSEGSFSPFTSEGGDGIETLDWIDRQSWSNGRVGLWGVSYLAYTGFMVLPSGHRSIKAMVNISGFSELDNFFGTGGAFYLQAHLTWFMSQAGGFPLPPVESRSQFMDRIFKTTPLSRFFGQSGQEGESMANAFKDISGKFDKVNVPILHLTGWHDYLYRCTLRTFQRIKEEHGRKAFQKLIVGPWYHNQELTESTVVGDIDFGPHAAMGLDKILASSISWFDRWLMEKPARSSDEDPVRIFVMGINEWREYKDWPPRFIDQQKWYFSSTNGANSSKGDGILSKEPSRLAGLDRFVFDPNDPVPTIGGANSHFFPDNLGVKNQAEIEKRDDVLVYTSPPLTSAMRIVGPIKVILFAGTDGAGTDFTAKLVELNKNGYARIVEDGIVRYSFKNSAAPSDPLKPGGTLRLEIDLGFTAIQLEPGSRIRVEISSSNFPKYDRNPNTGIDPMAAVEFKKAEQRVFFSANCPSHIILPVYIGDDNGSK